jgi:hypothetical protein
MPILREEGRRWTRGWRLGGLVLLGLVVAASVVLELRESPPNLLLGPRSVVVYGLHWARVHLLASSLDISRRFESL